MLSLFFICIFNYFLFEANNPALARESAAYTPLKLAIPVLGLLDFLASFISAFFISLAAFGAFTSLTFFMILEGLTF